LKTLWSIEIPWLPRKNEGSELKKKVHKGLAFACLHLSTCRTYYSLESGGEKTKIPIIK